MCNGFLGAGVAQLVEQRTRNAQVLGSIPSASSNQIKELAHLAFPLERLILQFSYTSDLALRAHSGVFGPRPKAHPCSDLARAPSG